MVCYSFFFSEAGEAGSTGTEGRSQESWEGAKPQTPRKIGVNTGELSGNESKNQRENVEGMRKTENFSPAASYSAITDQFILICIGEISRPKGAKKFWGPTGKLRGGVSPLPTGTEKWK